MLTDAKVAPSSWISIVTAIFNNLSGIGIINIFATYIFETILKKGAVAKLTAKQDVYFIGGATLLGSVLSYYSIAIFSRRAIFIGGHFFMAVLHFATGYWVHKKQAELVLLSMCTLIIVYQATQGSILLIYIAEISTSDAILGICVFTTMVCTTIQSMTSTMLMSGTLGIDGLFFSLGAIQVVAFFFFTFFLKETQGLSASDKKKLYVPEELLEAEKRQAENADAEKKSDNN